MVYLELLNNYIILDGIEGCMRIYSTRHDDIVNIIITSAVYSHTTRNKAIQYYYCYIIEADTVQKY